MVIAVSSKRAVAYLRVSTVDQAGERHSSLETQEARIRAYCEANGLAHVGRFTDVLSGRRDDRGEYRRMIDFMLNGGADVVVVQFLDRFGRNPREILTRIWQLQERNVQVVATDEDIREELVLLVRAGLAGAESKRTSERVRAYMGRSAEKGMHFGRAPYGYRFIKINDQITWEQEPREATAVREMYRLAVEENVGYKSIADELTRQGHPTREGRAWAAYTVQHVLTSESIAGALTYGKRPRKGNPERETVRVPDFFPAILTSDEWRRLQERLAIRRESARGGTHRSDYLLSGIARCGQCGGPMVGKV
ncbi:MAG: recombinase family protein, partial [Chloroflexi bacterium]|nr:recombinase family protein [Chloroflexota bacterium]